MQRRYYAETASRYDAMHVNGQDEHHVALCLLVASLDFLKVRSILDVGSGTGRAIRHIKKHRPDLRIVGIEPVKELREAGYAAGISRDDLVDGDAANLQFGAGEFDLVCAFAVLHHLRRPASAVAEMLRVAGTAVFISDSNNFGQGSRAIRSMKQLINFFGLWRMANLIKTAGKGYTVTEGDGVAYSYSVFDNYRQVQAACSHIHLINTKGGDINPYKTASHVALLGIKK